MSWLRRNYNGRNKLIYVRESAVTVPMKSMKVDGRIDSSQVR
jgi:hypothetical protein